MAEETAEQTIARLTSELQAAKNENAQLRRLLDERQQQANKAGDEITILKKSFEELQQSSIAEISQLSGELHKAKAVADKAEPTISVDGKDYIVHGKKFTYKQKEYTLEQLLKDKILQENLVKMGAGFLKLKA